jgi:hypothetical protein
MSHATPLPPAPVCVAMVTLLLDRRLVDAAVVLVQRIADAGMLHSGADGARVEHWAFREMLRHCRRTQQVEHALALLDCHRVAGHPLDRTLHNDVIALCATRGPVATAMQLVWELVHAGGVPSVATLEPLLFRHLSERNLTEALRFVDFMCEYVPLVREDAMLMAKCVKECLKVTCARSRSPRCSGACL